MTDNKQFKSVVARSASWVLIRSLIDQAFRFVLFVFLSRLLKPAEFGIFALSMVFVDLARVFPATGWGDTIIRAKKVDQVLISTIFWTVFGLSCFAILAICVLSPVLAIILKQPDIPKYLIAASGSLFFTPFSVVNGTRAVRDFRQRDLAVIGLSTSAIAGVLAVLCAYHGFGPWSFVVQLYTSAILYSLCVVKRFPIDLKPVFSKEIFHEARRYSSALTAGNLVQSTIVRFQELVSGKYLGAAAVGQYRVAMRSYDMLNSALMLPVSSIAMPTLARLTDQRERFLNTYFRMIGVAASVCCPAMIGFSAVGREVVPVLYGNQWTAAIPLVQVLGWLAPPMTLSFFYMPTLSSLGKTRTIFRIQLVQLATTVVFAAIALPFGLFGLACGWVARAYVVAPYTMNCLRKEAGIPPMRVIRELTPPVISCAIMSALLYLFSDIPIISRQDQAVLLVEKVVLGASIYIASMAVIFNKYFNHHLSFAKEVISSRRQGKAA